MTSVARAEELILVAVPTGDNPDYAPFESRLRAELTAAGFATVTEAISGPIDAAALSAHTTRLSTRFAISVSIANGMVSGLVYVANFDKSSDLIRTVPGYPIGEQAAGVFAVKATDVLHGVSLELKHPGNFARAPAPASEPTATEPPISGATKPHAIQPAQAAGMLPVQDRVENLTESKTRTQRGNWGVALGFELGAGLHSMPVTPGGGLGIYRQQGSWGASIEGSAYLPVTVTRTAGQGDLALWMLGGSVQLFQPLGRAFTIYESLGCGAFHLDVEGTGAVLDQSRNAASTAVYTYLGLGLIGSTSERTGIAFRFRVLAPWTYSDVIIHDEVVASVAFPTLISDVGLRLAL